MITLLSKYKMSSWKENDRNERVKSQELMFVLQQEIKVRALPLCVFSHQLTPYSADCFLEIDIQVNGFN